MLAFYMDHHVRAEITQELRRRGVDVLTAWEDGAAAQDDEHLLDRATDLGRILVTQDHDFLGIAVQWQRSSRPFPGIVYALQQDIDVGGTIEYLELVAILKTPDEMQNLVEYIPTK